ncbi:MAG: CRISPR-associated endonuclease Cas2 [Actinomycetota bacterium]|nr:CRISPR-associated endonuclease Cas2 [Actinomycetota bacterium]
MTYDVGTLTTQGERRLAQVAAICERYGVRVQYSVFECRLDAAGLERLKGELSDVLDPREDAVDIYRFDRSLDEIRTSLGRVRAVRTGSSWIF